MQYDFIQLSFKHKKKKKKRETLNAIFGVQNK